MARTRALLALTALGAALVLWLWPEAEQEPASEALVQSSSPRSRVTHTGRELLEAVLPAPDRVEVEEEALDRGLPISRLEDSGDSGVEPARIYTMVRGEGWEQARVRVECESERRWGWSGSTFQLPAGELCRIYAYRKDGHLQARSELVDLELYPGETLSLELDLPEDEIGGLGIGFSEHEEGVQVTFVQPGSPADEFGLQTGDIIVEVDGYDALELDQDEFIATMTGPVGSEVLFVVTWEGDTGLVFEELLLERALIN